MKKSIVLIFDVGTQSTRAMLIDSNGDILAKISEIHQEPYERPHIDWAEKDALFYYDNMIKCAAQLALNFPEIWAKIEGISITTIRDSVVCVDKNGVPLRKAILWLDKRKIDSLPKLNLPTKVLFKSIGIEETVRTHYKASACNWIRDNEPEIWAKTDKFLLLSAFLNMKLVGKAVDSVASVVGHVPFDVRTRTWQTKHALTRPVFDVPMEKLCDLVEATCLLGKLTATAANDLGLPEGVPVYASATDKACETVGLGCVNSDSVAISFGTTATLGTNSSKYVEPGRFIPPYPGMLQNSFLPEIDIYRGYWLISWFKKEFAAKEVHEAMQSNCSPEDLLNQRLHEIPAGCNGLIFQPYFTPSVNMPVAKGSVIGFSAEHTRIHLYRAIIEGINFALIEGMYHLAKRGNFEFKEIRIGGGGSKSAEICQITANMFGLPVIRTQTNEVSGIGAAMATFVGMGIFRDLAEASKVMVRVKDVFYPEPEQLLIYRQLLKDVFAEIYPKLLPLYERLTKIVKPQDREV